MSSWDLRDQSIHDLNVLVGAGGSGPVLGSASMQKLLPEREWAEITQCAGDIASHGWELDTSRSSAISLFYLESFSGSASVWFRFTFDNCISNQVQ